MKIKNILLAILSYVLKCISRKKDVGKGVKKDVLEDGVSLGALDFTSKDKEKKLYVIAQGPHCTVLKVNEYGGGNKTFVIPWTEGFEMSKNYFFTGYKNWTNGSLPQFMLMVENLKPALV